MANVDPPDDPEEIGFWHHRTGDVGHAERFFRLYHNFKQHQFRLLLSLDTLRDATMFSMQQHNAPADVPPPRDEDLLRALREMRRDLAESILAGVAYGEQPGDQAGADPADDPGQPAPAPGEPGEDDHANVGENVPVGGEDDNPVQPQGPAGSNNADSPGDGPQDTALTEGSSIHAPPNPTSAPPAATEVSDAQTEQQEPHSEGEAGPSDPQPPEGGSTPGDPPAGRSRSPAQHHEESAEAPAPSVEQEAAEEAEEERKVARQRTREQRQDEEEQS